MTIRHSIKALLVGAMDSTLFVRGLQAVREPTCVMLTLHRFAIPGRAHAGHDPMALRRVLAALRRRGVALLSVDEALRAVATGRMDSLPKGLSVSFSIDDGYADLVDVAAPVFAEFDCPATGFVVPGVVDGHTWFWWDKLDWILRNAGGRDLEADLADRTVRVSWTDEQSLVAARRLLESTIKPMAHTELLDVVDRLASAADLTLPHSAPEEYRVLGWDDLRAAEKAGLRFGAHSMTHPILSRCSPEQSRREIIESVQRVATELLHPVRTFCYPNGQPGDFGLREEAAVRESGLEFALTATAGLVTPRAMLTLGDEWRYRVPRFPYDEHPGRIIRYFV